MRNIVITRIQKRIFIFVAMIAAAFVIFLAFVYRPATTELAALRREYNMIHDEIDEVKRLVGPDKPIEQGILALKGSLDVFDKKFPDKEEVILRELSLEAQRLGIDTTSVRPQRKRLIKEIDGSPINIKECAVEEVPISMNLKTSYKTLGEFLRALLEEFPIFVRVVSVNIVKSEDKQESFLNVDLNLNAYLVCAEQARVDHG